MANKKTCRLCMSPTMVYHSLFTDGAVNKIVSLTSLEIREDEDLPTVACVKCWLNVKFAYKVQQTILETDRKLRDAVNKINIVEHNLPVKPEVKPFENIDVKSTPDNLDESPGTNTDYEVIVIKSESNFDPSEETDTVNESSSKETVIATVDDPDSTNPSNSHTKCAICGDNVNDQSMPSHIREHFFGEQTCECGETFDNITLYQEHFAKEHPDTESQMWTCDTCSLTFKYKSLYKLHIESAHQELLVLKNVEFVNKPRQKVVIASARKMKQIKSTPGANVNTSGEIFKCALCSKQFGTEHQLSSHSKQHQKKKCPICQAEITRYNFNKHVTMHTAGPSVCHLCGVTCKNFDSLRGHLYYTHSTNTYPCEICGQTFKKKYSRLMHIKKEHTGEKNYTCETCGKAFFTNYYLMKHIKMTHLKLRPYVCEHCNKGFSSKFALKTHVRQHTNDAPYKCEICGEGFRQNVSLRAHKKSKHNIIEEKTCKCKVCGKAFASEWAVKSHGRLHY